MLKPLLHTLPSLSGNVTLACNLTDYKKVGDEIECHVRYARLVPLSSNLAIKKCEVSLLTSSYEFDLHRFYGYYPNHFYKSTFTFNEEDYTEFIGESALRYRDKDFEFGVKRVTCGANNGTPFAFFAPFWAESEDDIPDYFLIKIKINSFTYDLEKTVKVLVKDYDQAYRYNYLWKYLTKYFKQVDSNVVYCQPFDKKATYYGVSLLRGGFSKMVDSVVGKNYYMQSSIGKFDENVTDGFRRMKLCMKQVMPISFYFDPNDFFTENEKQAFKEATMTFSGTWWKGGKKVPFYDFSTDYNYFTQKTWGFKSDGVFDYIESKKNIMDVSYPSLNEASLQEYKYFNAATKSVARWKLKYSKDENPYITNMSFAFSWLQGSVNKYREFPSIYAISNGYSDRRNNLVLPRKKALKADDSLYKRSPRTLQRYQKALVANSSNWFTTAAKTEWYEKFILKTKGQVLDKAGQWYRLGSALTDVENDYDETLSDVLPETIEDPTFDNSYDAITVYVKLSDEETNAIANDCKSTDDESIEPWELTDPVTLYIRHTIFDNGSFWSDVSDGKAYVNGILYDLTKIWRDAPETPYIDKFGVFVKPVLNAIPQNKLHDIKAARWTLLTNDTSITKANAFVHTDIKKMLVGEPLESIESLYMNELGYGKKMNQVMHDCLFMKNESDNEDGTFIDLLELGYDIFSLNRYYKMSEIQVEYPEEWEKIDAVRNRYTISSFEFVPVYRLSQIANSNDFMFYEHKMANGKWIYDSMWFTSRDNLAKAKYSRDMFKSIIKKSTTEVLETPMMLSNEFISAYSLSYLTELDNEAIGSLQKYSFNPIFVDANEEIIENVFTKVQPVTWENYGDRMPDGKAEEDLDVIYVSQYNLAKALPEASGMSVGVWIGDDKLSCEMYCKIIGESHLKVYLTTTCRNFKRDWPDYHPIETLYIKKRVMRNDYKKRDLDIYDNMLKLLENMYAGDELTDFDKTIRVMKDLVYYGDGCWGFSEDYCKTHDAKAVMDDTWGRVKDPMEYRFELVYKGRFVKLNDKIWEAISIENGEEYHDFYLYKVSRERNYPKALPYFYGEDRHFADDCETLHWEAPPVDDNSRNCEIIGSICINGEMSRGSNSLEVGAFFRDECLYTGRMEYDEDAGMCLADIKFYESAIADINPALVRLKLYDHTKRRELSLECSNWIHEFNDMGSIGEPCVLRFTGEDWREPNLHIEDAPTGMTIEPLFNSIWLQDREATIIYSEWQQSKISEVTADGLTGVSKFYRYDCDEIPFMYDISEFDTSHAYFSNGISYWLPLAYIESAKRASSPEVGTIEYEIQNNYDTLVNGQFKVLPSYRKLNGGSSSISLAYGTTPVKHYYSAYSYNMIIPTEHQENSYYSEFSHGRIDLTSMGELNLVQAITSPQEQYFNTNDDGGDDVSYYVVTSTLKVDELLSYHDIHVKYTQKPILYDDLGLYDKWKVSTYVREYIDMVPVSYVDTIVEQVKNPDGITVTEQVTYAPGLRYDAVKKQTTYGMIWIDSVFDNTNSSFNLVDLYNSDKKYFTAINGTSIYNDDFPMSKYFKEVIPFSKLKLREALKSSTFIVKPSIYSFTNYWKAVSDENGLLHAYWFSKPLGSTSLERYFDSIVPYIPEMETTTAYSLKYKSTADAIMDFEGDSALYKSSFSPWMYSAPRIYSSKDEFVSFEETERKHFNDSKLLNLEHEITIDIGTNLLYEEVLEAEKEKNVIAEFAKHVRQFTEADDNRILFLYNKYDVKYDSTCIGIDYDRINKIYSLRLKFTLK